MANTNSLPIYRDTCKLVSDYITVYENIKNIHKYHIGGFLYDYILGLLPHIIKANRYSGEDRLNEISDYLDDLTLVTTTIRILSGSKLISLSAYTKLSETIDSLTKQATAWKSKTEGNSPKK